MSRSFQFRPPISLNGSAGKEVATGPGAAGVVAGSAGVVAGSAGAAAGSAGAVAGSAATVADAAAAAFGFGLVVLGVGFLAFGVGFLAFGFAVTATSQELGSHSGFQGHSSAGTFASVLCSALPPTLSVCGRRGQRDTPVQRR